MQFIHSREYLKTGDTVVVESDTQCNVMLTDDCNFKNYKSGRSFRHYGGFYERFPIKITAPNTGNWNITLDVGQGYKANIRYSIRVIKG